jgi:hypothetical protein
MKPRDFVFASIVIFLLKPMAVGQQSVFESGNGDSSIFLSGKTGLLSYNLGDSTARFGFTHDAGSENPVKVGGVGRMAYGLGAGGTVDSNAAALVNKNSSAPGGFAEGALLFKPLFAKSAGAGIQQSKAPLNGVDKCKDPQDPECSAPGPAAVQANNYFPDPGLSTDGLAVQFHYGRTQFYLLPSATSPVASPSKTNFDQYRGTVAYNQVRHYQICDLRIGVAFAPGTSNNLSNLTQETYQPQVVTITSTGQSLLSGKSETVYIGSFTPFLSLPIDADLVFQPMQFKHLIGFDLFLRSELGGGASNRYGGPGLGIYFFKSGSPVIPLGGVAYSYKNGQSQVAVVIGWTFGGVQSPVSKQAPAPKAP